MPFTEAPGNFGWGAWAEVDWPTFERYLELFDEDGTTEPPRSGKLANHLPGYQGSLGTSIFIQFRDPSKRPTLFLRSEDQSQLALDQRAGIGNVRYHEILGLIEGK